MQNNNNGDGVAYYIGPYCSRKDSYSIHLGIFTDAYCTAATESSLYYDGYGGALPYSETSIVNSECIDCKKGQENNNNNNNGNAQYDEVSEACENIYPYAVKCETKMSTSINAYPDTSGCAYINEILPRSSITTKQSSSNGSSGKGAKAFAVIFAFTTTLFAAYAYFLYRKIKRGNVDLSSQLA